MLRKNYWGLIDQWVEFAYHEGRLGFSPQQCMGAGHPHLSSVPVSDLTSASSNLKLMSRLRGFVGRKRLKGDTKG